MIDQGRRHFILAAGGVTGLLLSGCGGGSSDIPTNSTDPQLPVILIQPADAIVTEGDSANFMVVADSDTPVFYQWMRNSTDINGATAATYTATGVSVVENGDSYSVAITNSAVTITSDAAILTVLARELTVDSTFMTADSTSIIVA